MADNETRAAINRQKLETVFSSCFFFFPPSSFSAKHSDLPSESSAIFVLLSSTGRGREDFHPEGLSSVDFPLAEEKEL